MSEEKLNDLVEKLISMLLKEQGKQAAGLSECDYLQKRELLRRLMVTRKPAPLSSEFMQLQNKLLSYETSLRKIQTEADFDFKKRMAIFFGDIRTIKCDAIVNAGNPKMLGSFDVDDVSIDSVIIMAGGLQIRQELNLIVSRCGRDEERGQAIITNGYNLPCKFIIHTVGPEISRTNFVSLKDKLDLGSCYTSCLELAKEKGLTCIAFPAISTGAYRFPKELAAKIAVTTVKDWLNKNNSKLKVIFCVYDEETNRIYHEKFRDYDIR